MIETVLLIAGAAIFIIYEVVNIVRRIRNRRRGK